MSSVARSLTSKPVGYAQTLESTNCLLSLRIRNLLDSKSFSTLNTLFKRSVTTNKYEHRVNTRNGIVDIAVNLRITITLINTTWNVAGIYTPSNCITLKGRVYASGSNWIQSLHRMRPTNATYSCGPDRIRKGKLLAFYWARTVHIGSNNNRLLEVDFRSSVGSPFSIL